MSHLLLLTTTRITVPLTYSLQHYETLLPKPLSLELRKKLGKSLAKYQIQLHDTNEKYLTNTLESAEIRSTIWMKDQKDVTTDEVSADYFQALFQLVRQQPNFNRTPLTPLATQNKRRV